MSQTRQEQITLPCLTLPDIRKDGDIDDLFLRQSQVRVGTCHPIHGKVSDLPFG